MEFVIHQKLEITFTSGARSNSPKREGEKKKFKIPAFYFYNAISCGLVLIIRTYWWVVAVTTTITETPF